MPKPLKEKRSLGRQKRRWEDDVKMKMAVFSVVAPCSLVQVYRRFRGSCCLHHQDATTQKAAIFILAAVRI
jgi:hypothetical protein